MKREKRIQREKRHFYKIVYLVVCVLVLCGTLLPGHFLVQQSKGELARVSAVPAEYYSAANLAVARNASAQLGSYQKLQLITGEWESFIRDAASYEITLADYEAAAMAKEQIEILYQKGIYPNNLKSDYENWYTWDAKTYKAVDATFATYVAYYWDISFQKYDGSESHRVCMLEDGTIFLAEADIPRGLDTSGLKNVTNSLLDAFFAEGGSLKTLSIPEQSVSEYLAGEDTDTSGLQWMALTQMISEEETYEVVQAYDSKRYLFTVYPKN